MSCRKTKLCQSKIFCLLYIRCLAAYGVKAGYIPYVAHCRALGEHFQFSTLLKGTLEELWTCPGISPYYLNNCHLLSTSGLEVRTICFTAQSLKDRATSFDVIGVDWPTRMQKNGSFHFFLLNSFINPPWEILTIRGWERIMRCKLDLLYKLHMAHFNNSQIQVDLFDLM